ncbi:MAG: right-handed parallel beta-helix repeat-containing protein, partial [Synergistales bacterium]|nr:right-handed parallel beta-helix repeat-containing protein [Synergistales bacterium]
MVFSCLLAFTSFAEGAVKRVTVNGGIAPRDGNSWEKAFSVEDFRNIHAMTPDAEFWLAAGVYAPGTALQRDNAFFLASGTSIYGGFAGNETSRDQRDPRANITVLTGDIDGNDTRDANGVTTAINGNNSYTVVVAENVNSTAILDGVVITGGDASNNGGTEFQKNGGGMVCKNSSAIVRSCSFAVNRAVQYGGAAAIQNQSPAFANCTFSGNSSGDYGGAVFVYGASPVFTNCTFSDNDSGASGGGMYNYDGSSPTVTGCTFSDNSASDNGGGMANVDGCHPAVKNCTFSGNEAQTLRGGGMFNSIDWLANWTTPKKITFGTLKIDRIPLKLTSNPQAKGFKKNLALIID